MNDDDVHPDEMSETHEFDDEAIDALLSGTGAEINEDLAAAVDAVRAAYTSQAPVVGPELALLIGDGWAPAPSSRSPRRMRLPVALRRFAVATAALFALTGALGVANALPGPMQDAVAKVGIGSPNNNHGKTVSEVAKDKSLEGCEHGRAVSAAASGKTNDKPCPNASTTTSTTATTTSTTGGGAVPGAIPGDDDANSGDNPGKGVSDVAKDKSLQGCEHGRAVSGAASGKTKDKPCPQSTTTTTTTPGGGTTGGGETVESSAPGNSGSHGQDGTKPKEDGNNNGNGRPTGKVKNADEQNGNGNDD